MSKPSYGQCKFCSQVTRLVRSHVAPKSILRTSGLLGENGVQDKMTAFGKSEGTFIRMRKSDLWEYLLCEPCDRLLGREYDQYLHSVLDKIVLPRLFLQIKHPQCQVDQRRFRLGILSILWRASAANTRYFRGIKLPAQDEDRLLQMLKQGDPEPYEFYPITLSAALQDGLPLTGGLCFDQYENLGVRFSRILMMGLLFTFYPGQAPAWYCRRAGPFVVRNNPLIQVFTWRDLGDTEYGQFLGEMARATEEFAQNQGRRQA